MGLVAGRASTTRRSDCVILGYTCIYPMAGVIGKIFALIGKYPWPVWRGEVSIIIRTKLTSRTHTFDSRNGGLLVFLSRSPILIKRFSQGPRKCAFSSPSCSSACRHAWCIFWYYFSRLGARRRGVFLESSLAHIADFVYRDDDIVTAIMGHPWRSWASNQAFNACFNHLSQSKLICAMWRRWGKCCGFGIKTQEALSIVLYWRLDLDVFSNSQSIDGAQSQHVEL